MKIVGILLFVLVLNISLVSCNKKVQEVDQIEKTKQLPDNDLKTEVEQPKKDFSLKKTDVDIEKLSFSQLNNNLYSHGGGERLYEKIKLLSKTGGLIDNQYKSTFLESFLGDYTQALENRESLCQNNPMDSFCEKVELKLQSYRPTDNTGKILDNVTITIDGRDQGLLKGKNSFSIENKFIHRVKISKQGYLDFYQKVYVDNKGTLSESINPKLLKADFEKVISSEQEQEVITQNFQFIIKPGTFLSNTGESYTGEVKLYAFDIGEEDGDINALNLDVFDSEGNYSGNSMVTHGMPLIKAYDMTGKELRIGKAIAGKGKIANQEKAVGIDLKSVEKNKWLGKLDLEKHNIPAFWKLNQDSGVWKESQMKIMDELGNYEFTLN